MKFKVLILLLICYAWCLLVLGIADLLFTIQNFTPWMGTWDFWIENVTHPGGLREWIGYFLTQFFYYPWLGATLLVACWALSTLALIKANRLRDGWQLTACIPMVALLAGITELGYWIFCLKARSFWFGPTLGLLAISLWQWGTSRLSEKGKLLSIASLILIGYPLLGWYATLGTITLLLSLDWARFGLSNNLYLKKIALRSGAVIIPLLLIYIAYYHTTGLRWRESFLLYGFHHLIIPEAESKLLETPFWVLAGSIVILPLLRRLQERLQNPIWSWMGLPLLALAVYGGNMLNYRNANFHTELRMLRALEEAQWDNLLADMPTVCEASNGHTRRPTREMVLLKDIALLHTGHLGSEAFNFDIRGIRPQMNIDLPIHMNHSAGPLIYYWSGLPNYAFMWCMEDNIEYGLSPFFLKLMYRSTMANRETEAARKYKALLETTLFYKDYEVSENELAQIRTLMTGHDELTNDRGYCEIYLLERLSQEQYGTPETQILALHNALLMRSKERFDKALRHLSEIQEGSASLPNSCQEGIALFKLSDYSISAEIQQRYDLYCKQIEELIKRGMSRDKIGEMLFPNFGNTYWWYYDFQTNSKTY